MGSPADLCNFLGECRTYAIELPDQTICHVAPLNAVQVWVLEILGFSEEAYTRLKALSLEPS